MIALATLGTIAVPATAHAQVVQNDVVVLVGFSEFIPCALNGVGEVVVGDVRLHVLITSTINGSRVSGTVHFQPQGGTLIGQTTGDTYRANGVTQESFSGSLVNGQLTATFVANFRIVGPGPGNNFSVHEVHHITVNASGTVTATHDSFAVNCR